MIADPKVLSLTADADDGVGIQGDHASGKPGPGTGIVNALAAQLSATVKVTDAHPGCLVLIIHR